MIHLGRGRKSVKRLGSSLWRRIRASRPWYQDLCEYYQVSPEQALQLGTRADGRRPDLPGSPTTHTVAGLTFEEIWQSRERRDPADIHGFYQDMGAWATFRQVVYHRDHSFDFLAGDIKSGMRVCEYGAGVAPVCLWLVEHLNSVPLELTIVDVPSEHLTFGRWRLERRIKELKSPMTVNTLEVLPAQLPLEGAYDVITVLEVYEHLHNPLEVTIDLREHMRAGGLLWENYIVHEEAHAADLAIAQTQRPEVVKYLRQHFELVSGQDPDSVGGGDTRCWRRL